MNKLFYYLGMLSIFMLIGIIGFVMFLAFYPFKVVDVVSPYPVLNENKTVKRGTDVYYLVEYEKFMQVRAESTWFIVCQDGNLVTLAPTYTNFPVGKKTVTRSMTVPMKTSLGKCKMVQTIEFKVNPLQTQTFNFESEEFTVVE